ADRRAVPRTRRTGVRRLRHHQADRSVLAVVRRAPVVRGRRTGEHRGPRSGDPAGGKGAGRSPPGLFPLARPPRPFTSVIGALGAAGLATSDTRVIIEKPFGTD